MVQITAGSFPSQVHLYEMQMVFLFHLFLPSKASGISRRPLTMLVFGVGTKANIYFFIFYNFVLFWDKGIMEADTDDKACQAV